MSDQTAIRECVENYYQSLSTSNADGVRSVFHPVARITGYLPDGLHEMTVNDFAVCAVPATFTGRIRCRVHAGDPLD